MKHKFITEIENLQTLLASKPREVKNKKLRDYGYGSVDLHSKNINAAIEKVRESAFDLAAAYKHNKKNKDAVLEILAIVSGEFNEKLAELRLLAESIRVPVSKKLKVTVPGNIPRAIRGDIVADLNELEKSFNSGCYRAATILLGRVLETSLHRKYYETTGLDILEKNPGIGLGKLIARLSEKNVHFDPGLTQQIHLINQVRVHSVHVKKRCFYPTEQQTYAMILYTLDVLEKMF